MAGGWLPGGPPTPHGPRSGKGLERGPNPPKPHYDVDPDTGCWIWNRNTTRHGYGMTRYGTDHRYVGAHRAYFAHYVAPIPAGLVVMHVCDTPSCVNPDHLAMATQIANTVDMTRKGRAHRGVRNGTATLTAEQVKEIRRRSAAGESNKGMAPDFGVSEMTIGRVVRGVVYKDEAVA